ncbi:hypothetical protein ACFOLF_05005 [Paenibacillus sepulcri]|uniref:BclA C-terminal domain-containing protein n=1 Tax=Paenibacillus sepulcri TaxID=359917 RepID=A0ABS7C9Z1_9BACL|nr:hypothetical protein [Paenibacillus sepulcri]
MGTFLDQRSSMNANASGSINVALTAAPALFGVIGLQTRSVANPIVDLTGTIGFSALVAGTTVAVQVVRGTLITDTIIYSAIFTAGIAGVNTRSFTAQDLLAPAAAQTTYSAFISSAVVGSSRVGPEVFWGLASSTV